MFKRLRIDLNQFFKKNEMNVCIFGMCSYICSVVNDTASRSLTYWFYFNMYRYCALLYII